MILEYVLNPANLILVGFVSQGGREHHSQKHRECFFVVFFLELKRLFAAHQGGFVSKMYLLFMFPIFPAGKHMLSFRLGKLQCHVKTT